MKPKFFILMVLSVFAFFNLSWAICPQDTVDLGFCDTVNVVPWDAISCDSFPCLVHVPLLITHDSNTFYWEGGSRWAQDSISCITVLLAWTRTNPAKYCSVSSFWNGTALLPSDPSYSRSVWRDFGGMENRMSWLAQQEQSLEWDWRNFHMASDSSWYFYGGGDSLRVPPHFWMSLIPTSPTNRRWWEGESTLLATITFRVQDTMTVRIDTTFRPPSLHQIFCRYDSKGYYPRDNMPLSMQIRLAQITVSSPNGGENWCVGETKDITWSSQGFYGPLVKIEYSPDAGTSWQTIEDSTQNDGTYSWTIPNTPSYSCLVRVSDASDGLPVDLSNNFFTIFLAGDANGDGSHTSADVAYLINYLFVNGPVPAPFQAGDVNFDGVINASDVVYFINYLFIGGPPPQCY
jgi:hypothetical protein